MNRLWWLYGVVIVCAVTSLVVIGMLPTDQYQECNTVSRVVPSSAGIGLLAFAVVIGPLAAMFIGVFDAFRMSIGMRR